MQYFGEAFDPNSHAPLPPSLPPSLVPALQVDCRRTLIMQYFGEAFDPSRCKKTCDNCQDEAATVTHDLTPLAQDTIRYVLFPPSLPPSLPPSFRYASIYKPSSLPPSLPPSLQTAGLYVLHAVHPFVSSPRSSGKKLTALPPSLPPSLLPSSGWWTP